MTHLEILEALCRAGTTEGKGTYYVPQNKNEVNQSIIDFFGQNSILDGDLKLGFAYLYSYEERLTNGRGEIGADAVVSNSDNEHIYLYSIEYAGD